MKRSASILVVAATVLAMLSSCSSKHDLTVSARFADVGDLAKYAPVMLADVKVGEVRDIRLAGAQALVTMSIDPAAKVPSDVTAKILRTSLLGERVVELVPPWNLPATAPLLHDGSAIGNTETLPDLEDLVKSGAGVLAPISASEVATLVDTGAQGFGGQAANLQSLLTNLGDIVHAYSGHAGEIRSVIESMNQLNLALAAHAQAQGLSLVNTDRALTVLQEESDRLKAAVKALDRLSIGARGILEAHQAQMGRFFSQMRTILGVLKSEQANIEGFLAYAPLHDRNTQLVEYQEFNQIMQDFVICGLNDDPSDPARSCK